MNKKLFSWKALAGLALLVAMGMTSCKNTTEVDPNDPYNTQKPTKPSSSLDGDYDWEVTIAKTSDFADQWKSVASKVQKAVAEVDQIDIKINCGAYALDGKTLSLPAIWKNNEGKIINVVFSGSFKSKTDADGNELALDVNTDNVAGAEVNIYLPTDEFDFNLAATKVKPTLYGESTVLDLFSAEANDNKKNAMVIGDGVKVNVITMSGALAGTDNVEALLVKGDIGLKEGKGAQVGNQEVYVKSLVVAANATVKDADKAALETVTVAEGTTLTLGSAKSEIESIVGLGTAKKPTKLVMKGDADDFSKIGAITNVNVSGNAKDKWGYVIPTKIEDASIFENVVFDMDVDLYSSATGLDFNGEVNVMIDETETVKFSEIDFGKKAQVSVNGGTAITGKKTLVNMLQWEKSSKKYVEVKDADEDNLTAANAKSEGVDIIQSISTKWSTLSDPTVKNLSWDGLKFHHDLVEAAELKLNGNGTTIDGAKKEYDKKVAADGIHAANTSTAYTKYKAAWEKLNGKQNASKDPITDKDGKECAASFTAYTTEEIAKLYQEDKITYSDYVGTEYNGYYRYYATELAFVKDANTKIDGCDWFTIYHADTEYIEPEDVDVIFEDCTFGGKDLDVEKLNSLIVSPTFTSTKDAWWFVTLDGETLEWKKTTGGFILK